MHKKLNFKILKNKTLIKIYNKDDQELCMTTVKGEKYQLYHQQDCCEDVYIEDICGDLDDLLGVPLLQAEVVSSYINPSNVNSKIIERQDKNKDECYIGRFISWQPKRVMLPSDGTEQPLAVIH